jgi:hypothetical protein
MLQQERVKGCGRAVTTEQNRQSREWNEKKTVSFSSLSTRPHLINIMQILTFFLFVHSAHSSSSS